MPTALLLSIAIVGLPVPPAIPCSIGELRESPGYQYRIDRVAENVDSAARIVRVRAIRADSGASTVTVLAVEWLRGKENSDTIVLRGVAVERDDFNALPVPYQMVRPAGQRGDCYAHEYRLGREYLLLLRDGVGRYPLYWWPLGPVNEQLHGVDDAWLKWVRERVNRRPSSPGDT